jgi:hypothetical protein
VSEVKLATASWVRNGAGAAEAYTLQEGAARSDEALELAESLFVLRHYSPYDREEALLAAVLEAVRTPTGTMQEVYHLHTSAAGETLLRFDVTGDVTLRPGVSKTHTNLPAEASPPALDTSLRAYLEVLYLTPQLSITLRGQPVVHRSVAAGLYHTHDAAPYKPRGASVTVCMKLGLAVEDDDEPAAGAGAGGGRGAGGRSSRRGAAAQDEAEFGAGGARLSRRSGVALYWQGRLIRYCEPLGMQRNNGVMGAGVCGVADVGDLLTPLPTKQAFEQDEHHQRLLKELGDRLNAYTNELVTTSVIDPDLQRRRLTDAAAGALAAVRAKLKLDKALEDDPRRTLRCADCFKHRFINDSVDEAAFEALDAADWRCSMHPDAVAAGAGCEAEQEAPRDPKDLGPITRTEKPLPDWLLAYGDKAVGWRMVHVSRGRMTYGCSYAIYYYSPAGVVLRSRPTVEAFIEAGGDMAARRLTDAAVDAAVKRGKGSKKRGKGKAAPSDDEDDDAAEPAPAKKPRGRSAIQQLAVVKKEKEKANREVAANERKAQRDIAAKKAELAKEKAAFERQKEVDAKRRETDARRTGRAAAGAGAPRARGARICRCQRTLAECADQLTVECDECGNDFHAECLGLACAPASRISRLRVLTQARSPFRRHDVAEGMCLACADHADAAVEARKAAALLVPNPRAARRGGGGANPAPSPSGSMFELFHGAGGAGADDAGTARAGQPSNWPRSVGSPAFLTHNVHGAWPSPEAWALLHATHDQSPLPGVEIRTLPMSHKLAKPAIGAQGNKPRGLFATRGFPQGAIIGEYVGHVRHATSMDGAAQYLFELSTVATADGRKVRNLLQAAQVQHPEAFARQLIIDAGPCGNETRFINWHRGLASAPNCEFEEVRVLRGAGSCAELVVRVKTTRRILREEEFLIDYGGLYTLPGEALRGDDDNRDCIVID